MNGRSRKVFQQPDRTAGILCLMLLSVTATAEAANDRANSAACAWSGNWVSSDGSITQTLRLKGRSLNGSFTLRDVECPEKITGGTELTLDADGLNAYGTYYENSNSCWGASSGEIAYAITISGNRIDYTVRTEEGEEFYDFMLKKQAAASPDCDSGRQQAEVVKPQAVKKASVPKVVKPRDAKGDNKAKLASRFVTYQIVDETRNMVAAVIKIPADWQAQSDVVWSYQDSSFPVRMSARAESQSGEAWVQGFPTEMFFWLEPDYQPMSNGVRSLGMIKQTPITADQALLDYVVLPQRGGYPDFRVVSSREVNNLAETMGDKAVSGQGVAIRVAYQENGRPVQEEFYALLSDIQSVPYQGPQGTTYEYHMWLQYVHSLGAVDNQLDRMKPLLGGIAASFTVNPSWLQAVAQIKQHLVGEFNDQLAQDYATIQAAGQLSRQISAQNDAWLANFEQQRIASDRQMDEFMAGMQSQSDAYDKANENFSQYMRGTEKMQDPYWGDSDQPYDYQYHWTDGLGNYRQSNDLGDDPNIGSTQNWVLMQPVP